MTHVQLQTVLARVQRDLWLATAAKAMLLLVAMACLFLPDGNDNPLVSINTLGLLTVCILWLALTLSSVKGGQAAHEVDAMLAGGDYDAAEAGLQKLLRRFSIYRGTKLMACHKLAILVHTRQQFSQSVQICRLLLTQRLGPLAIDSELLLADALLMLGEPKGTHAHLSRLARCHLNLSQQLTLLPIRLGYELRCGAPDAALARLNTKIHLISLMPPFEAAQSSALLAMAARREGKPLLCKYLWTKARLYADIERMTDRFPELAALAALPTLDEDMDNHEKSSAV